MISNPNPNEMWWAWASRVVQQLGPWAVRIESVKFTQGQILKLRPATVADLPEGQEGDMIYVSDETGGAVPAFHDGTNWRRVTDRAVVS